MLMFVQGSQTVHLQCHLLHEGAWSHYIIYTYYVYQICSKQLYNEPASLFGSHSYTSPSILSFYSSLQMSFPSMYTHAYIAVLKSLQMSFPSMCIAGWGEAINVALLCDNLQTIFLLSVACTLVCLEHLEAC